jgi:hypothetical protein
MKNKEGLNGGKKKWTKSIRTQKGRNFVAKIS